MRKWVRFTAWSTTLVVLAACSPDPKDFRHAAEAFIDGKEITAEAGTSYTGARCDEPSSADAGTVFHCTATAADGSAWTFDVTIQKNGDFEVIGRQDG